MTDYQKKRITLMRKQNIGYSAIAKELRLSLGSVKAFCRRNDLQSTDIATFGLLLMGPAVATMRFFDTLNKVESKLNKQMESMSKP